MNNLKSMTYYDEDGNERSLEWLVRNSPEWGANRMRSDRTEINLLKSEVELLKESMGEKDRRIERFRKQIISWEDANAEKLTEIERLHEQVQDMIDASGQQCGCGYDKPDDVCLGHWPKYKKQQDEIERLREALEGVLNCPQMADAELLGPWGCPESAAAEAKARAALATDPTA